MNKSKRNNIIFLVVIALLLIPQTRKPIQVLLHKGIALINPVSLTEISDRVTISNYNWKLQKEDGKPYNFEDARGKVIILNFWATWCPPCIAEMPSLQELYVKYGNEVVFLFATSDAITTAKAFKTKNQYTFPVYKILSNPPAELETSSIPRTLIFNQKGEIVIDKSGAVNWFGENIQSEIDKLLIK